MKAIVIGLGSMGRRRIGLLKLYDSTIEIIGVDTQAARRQQAEDELGIATCEDIDSAINTGGDIELAFVSTSPLSHADIITECLNRGLHTFTEINLVDTEYDRNMKLAADKGMVLFLSSTPMYRREVEYIRSTVSASNFPVSYIYHVGQYLPDWHPWENYKDFFVSDRATNACREIMAIEFPWLFDVFGSPIRWESQCCRSTDLDIDYPDTFHIMLTHPNGGIGSIQIDVASRCAVRSLECISEDIYISWNGTPEGLVAYDHTTGESTHVRLYEEVNKRADYSPSIIENAYLAEIEEFMRVIRGEAVPRHDFRRDKDILRIIDEIGA